MRMAWAVVLIVFCLVGTLPLRAEVPVTMELVTGARFPAGDHQRWMTLMKDLGVGVRIRGSRGAEQPKVTMSGTEAYPRYNVIGLLTRENRLLLTGGIFRVTEKQQLSQWLDKLKTDGIEGLTEPTVAFGLTAKRLLQMHGLLAKEVTFSTRGERTYDVVARIVSDVPQGVSLDTGAQAMLRTQDIVADELKGLSQGTALAAALRPLGLSLVPEKLPAQKFKLVIKDSRRVTEAWPIGWPRQETPGRTMPALFRYLEVAINDTPLTDALAAVQQRVEAPFLFDHNALAKHRIDPTQARVNYPGKRTFYASIINKLLYQAKLKQEIRVDEAGKPFLWITTIKK